MARQSCCSSVFPKLWTFLTSLKQNWHRAVFQAFNFLQSVEGGNQFGWKCLNKDDLGRSRCFLSHQEGAIASNQATGRAPVAACVFLGIKASLPSNAEVLDQACVIAVLTDHREILLYAVHRKMCGTGFLGSCSLQLKKPISPKHRLKWGQVV